jgi:hypothetical protein
MFEFAEVFASDLTSTFFLAGSLAAMMMFAAVAIWMNREAGHDGPVFAHLWVVRTLQSRRAP